MDTDLKLQQHGVTPMVDVLVDYRNLSFIIIIIIYSIQSSIEALHLPNDI